MPRQPALSRPLLEAALAGLEAQRSRIDAQLTEVRQLLGRRGPGRPPASQSTETAPAPRKRRKRRLSPEGRAAIVAGVKKRWAAIKESEAASTKKTAPPTPRKRKKRKLSPEGRAAIVAAAKKRWAAVKKRTA